MLKQLQLNAALNFSLSLHGSPCSDATQQLFPLVRVARL